MDVLRPHSSKTQIIKILKTLEISFTYRRWLAGAEKHTAKSNVHVAVYNKVKPCMMHRHRRNHEWKTSPYHLCEIQDRIRSLYIENDASSIMYAIIYVGNYDLMEVESVTPSGCDVSICTYIAPWTPFCCIFNCVFCRL